MDKKQNLYQILGVSSKATQKELESNFRKQALKWHPDKNHGEEEQATKKFQSINRAYQILRDPKKRENYDLFGITDEQQLDLMDDIPDIEEMEKFFEIMMMPLMMGGKRSYTRMMRDLDRLLGVKKKQKKDEKKEGSDEDWETESEEELQS